MNRERFLAAVSRLHSFINYERQPPSKYGDAEYNLDRMRRLLAALGEPHARLSAIHLAGTDGKGSTASLCAHFLSRLGFRTGLNTSPHLEDIRERFRIDGAMMPEDTFVALFERVLEKLPGEHAAPPAGHGFATVFEIITAMAFLYFAEEGVDYAVVEVGMGGRLDATNVLIPKVAVITQLGIDHTRHLGATLEAIAREKLGIVKPGVPVVVTPQMNVAESFVREEVAARGGNSYFVSELLRPRVLERRGDGYVFEFLSPDDGRRRVWRHPLPGDHQVANACTALLALWRLPEFTEGMPWEALQRHLLDFSMPGRFEVLARAGRARVVLDVAHTEQAARVLLRTLDQVFPTRPRRFVIGQMSDKDTTHYLQSLLRPEDCVMATRVDNPRARRPEEIREILVGELAFAPEQVSCREEPCEALDSALREAGEEELVVVAGSIYLVGALRTRLGELGFGVRAGA